MMWWQWHQLDNMQIICTSSPTDNHARTSSLIFFTGQVLFLAPNQQCQMHGRQQVTYNNQTKKKAPIKHKNEQTV